MSELDLFGPRPAKPEPHLVHRIVISEAWWEDDEDEPDYDYELVHPEGCIAITEGHGECSVWMDLQEGGTLRDVLMGPGYQWGNVDKQPCPWVTTYYVRTWVTKHDIPGEPIEYDQGLYVGLKEQDV